MKGLGRDDSGTVYAEFIMAFPPFFLLFLGIIQLSFIATGGIVVQAAAMKSARAAIVILPDDPFFYEKEPQYLLDFKGQSDNDEFQSGLTSQLGEGGLEAPGGVDSSALTSGFPGSGGSAGSESGEGEEESVVGPGGPRLNAIRLAAYLTLAPLGPDPLLLLTWFGTSFGLDMIGVGGPVDRYSIRKTALGESPTMRFFTGLFVYNAAAAAINFPTAPSSPDLRNGGEDFTGEVRYGQNEDFTVRITYLFPCTVPIVNHIVCREIDPGSANSGTLSEISDAVGTVRDVIDAVQNDITKLPDALSDELSEEEQGLMDELRAGVKDADMLETMLRAPAARFHVLRAEATMPIQGAPYLYPTE